MTANTIETELKFRVPDRHTFNALKKLTRVEGFRLEAAGVKTISDQYLDTASRRVLRAGYACRLRQQKSGLILTLKSLTPASGALHRRQEIECDVPGQAPATWPDCPATGLLRRITGDEPLELLFNLHQTRHKFLVKTADRSVIELSIDEVSPAKAGQPDYLGLEAELIREGSEADLSRFAEQLTAQFTLWPETISKFEMMFTATFGRMSMYNLTDQERTQLELFTADGNESIAKRARLVLLSDAGQPAETIAGEVGFAPATVKKYQRIFGQKRMAFFPEAPPAPAIKATAAPVAEAVAAPPAAQEDSPVTETSAAPPESIATPEPATAQTPDPKKEKKRLKKLKKKVGVEYPVRKSVGLQATDSFAEAGRKVLSFHFARMLKHEPGTRLGNDIEELHDMRVATRRMRAAFDLFAPAFQPKTIAPLLAGLKATGRALGPVRDLDVFIEKFEQYQAVLPPEEQAQFEVFLNMWRKRRAAARKTMIKYLDSKAYRRFKKDFHKFAITEGQGVRSVKETVPPTPQELRHVVPGLVYSAYDGVRAYETVLDNAPIETLHQLRISFKGLRYTLEFIEEVLGEGKEMVIGEVKAMQDYLGDLNDADVAAQILEDFLSKWSKKQRKLTAEKRQSAAPMQAYLATQIEKREALLTGFPDLWEQFNRAEFRQTLAQTISML
ncbi:MAG: hypothetical protein Kow0031_01220 [Anaerolineae bacterium]